MSGGSRGPPPWRRAFRPPEARGPPLLLPPHHHLLRLHPPPPPRRAHAPAPHWGTSGQHQTYWHHQHYLQHHQSYLQQHHSWTTASGAKKDCGALGFGGPHHQHQHQPEPQQQQAAPLPAAPPPPSLLVGEKASKEDEEALWSNVEAQAAFLGPNLWDRTLPYDADLKEYVDLDEFLSENGIPVEGGEGASAAPVVPLDHRPPVSTTPPPPAAAAHHEHQPPPAENLDVQRRRTPSRSPRPESYDGGDERHYPGSHEESLVKVEQLPSRGRMLPLSPQPPLALSTADAADAATLLSGCPPSPAGSDFSMSSSTTTTTGHDFDPRTRAFSDEELKPQPMIKKSKKQFVPDDLKDEKYWARRRKNNMAAKRSRDARRVKENQIALRAGFLEKENLNLRQELERLKKENSILRDRLTKFTEV